MKLVFWYLRLVSKKINKLKHSDVICNHWIMELVLSKKCLNWGFLFFPELGIFEGRQE